MDYTEDNLTEQQLEVARRATSVYLAAKRIIDERTEQLEDSLRPIREVLEAAKEELVELSGDGSLTLSLPDAKVSVARFTSSRIDSKLLRSNYPDIAALCSVESAVRTRITITQSKEG